MTPAPVDHEARRTALSEAVADVVAAHGVEGVSVRTVATAAGVSVGTVQHYFPTKDAMLLHAHAAANARVSARADAAVEDAASPREALRALLLAVLPTDEESRRLLRVFLAFDAAALHSPALAARTREDNHELHTLFVALFRTGGATHPEREARAAVTLFGLVQPLLLDDPTCTYADAVEVVDAHLDRVLPR